MIILIYKILVTNVYISELFLFLFLNIIILSTIVSFFSKNPVYSLLFLILNYIIAGFLFLLNNFIFLSLLFILIYVGAVSILLLFTLMLLNLKIIYYKHIDNKFLLYLIVTLILVEFLIFFYFFNFKLINFRESSYKLDWFLILNLNSDLFIISTELFLFNSNLVVIIGILLLAALLASVNIVHNLKNCKKQNAYHQLKNYSSAFVS